MDRSALALTPWPVTAIWKGLTVFILGGGASLRGFDYERLRGRTVLAINEAAAFASWADALYFQDWAWFDSKRRLIGDWRGEIFTTCRRAKADSPERVRLMITESRPDFLPGAQVFRRGRSSGHSAISLAIGVGAARIVLLGFDMRLVDGRSHFHDGYGHADKRLYERDFIPAFEGWDAAARRAGVQVVNATPLSALHEFRCRDIDDVFSDRSFQ